jgi:hypothetical protein
VNYYNPYTETAPKKRSRYFGRNLFWIIPLALVVFMLLLLVAADTI